MRFEPKSKSIKRVVVIGPECTGKSELSEFLSKHFHTLWVKEYARSYLETLDKSYEESDLLKIAKGQLRSEDEAIKKANELIICDTNLLVIKIWSEFKYGRCDEEILNLISSRKYDLFLLTDIDIPWQHDPQREHPNKRATLWKIYKSELENQSTPVVKISGERKQRREIAVHAIESLLRSNT